MCLLCMGNCTQPTAWLELGEKSGRIQNVNPHAFTKKSRFSRGTAYGRFRLLTRIVRVTNHSTASIRTSMTTAPVSEP